MNVTIATQSTTSRPSCGVLRCSENVSDGILASLTVYKLGKGDTTPASHWEQLASVMSQSPSNDRTPDGLDINGELSDKEGKLTLDLPKSQDCGSDEFLCMASIVREGKIMLIKSTVRNVGSSGSSEGHTAGNPGDHHAATRDLSHNSLAETRAGGIKEHVFTFSLWEKMERLEKRMDDFYSQKQSFEARIEDLKDTVKVTIGDKLQAIGNRLGDRLDMMENRLEDKLLGARSLAGPTTNNAEICQKFSSQISSLTESLWAMEKNLTTNVEDAVSRAETATTLSASSVTQLGRKLDGWASSISNISDLTGSLVSSFDDFRKSCSKDEPVSVSEFFDVLDAGKKDWRLAFRGTAYTGVPIYPAYLYGTGIPSEVEAGCKQFNHSLPCANHYRNRDVIENWENIDEVLFAVFVKGQMVKNVVFNARGSNYINWFEANRVVSSSWTDLKTASHNYFSIIGHDRPSGHYRKFYISHKYNGCDRDLGWFTVSDMPNSLCPWERSVAIPEFLYAPGNTMAFWSSPSFGRADAIGVFVKYY